MNTEKEFTALFWTVFALMLLMRFWLHFAPGERASDFGQIALLINARACGRMSPDWLLLAAVVGTTQHPVVAARTRRHLLWGACRA